MPVITVEGRTGSSAPEIAMRVAKVLGIDFIDRLLLGDIARNIGSTIEAISETELQGRSKTGRFALLIQNMMRRSALEGLLGDPYFGPGIQTIMSRPYYEMDKIPHTSKEEIDGQRFIDTTSEVIGDLAEIGNVVIVGRGGGAILRNRNDALRIATVSNDSDRLRRIMDTERLDEKRARNYMISADNAQDKYFRIAFGTGPLDPTLYHVTWNTSEIDVDYIVQATVEASRTYIKQIAEA